MNIWQILNSIDQKSAVTGFIFIAADLLILSIAAWLLLGFGNFHQNRRKWILFSLVVAKFLIIALGVVIITRVFALDIASFFVGGVVGLLLVISGMFAMKKRKA